MKLFLGSLVVVIFLARDSSPSPSPTEININELDNASREHYGPKSSAEIMPGRQLSSQEIRNLIYIAQEDARTMPVYSPILLKKSNDNENESIKPVPRRKKRFIFNRNHNAQNWIARRQQRIRLRNERRRLRLENFIRRGQLRLQAFNNNAMRVQQIANTANNNNLNNINTNNNRVQPLFQPFAFFNPLRHSQSQQPQPYVIPTTTIRTTALPQTTISASTTAAETEKLPPVTFQQAPLPREETEK